MVATLNPVKIIMTCKRATPINKSLGRPMSKKIPKMSGLKAAPRSIPEYTIPYTLPDEPDGVAERTIKSRDGAAIPKPTPVTINGMTITS